MVNKHAYFDFNNLVMMSIYQDDKLIKGWDITEI